MCETERGEVVKERVIEDVYEGEREVGCVYVRKRDIKEIAHLVNLSD